MTCTPTREDKVDSDILKDVQSLDIKSDRQVDSILATLTDSSMRDEEQVMGVHVFLQKIIDEKSEALKKLDQINSHLDSIQAEAEEFVSKKRASAELKRKLLADIQKLQNEIAEIKPKTLTEVIQKPIPNSLKSLTELEPGNYKTRLDRTHVLAFYVSEDGDIFVSPVIIDSTTMFNGTPLSPKVLEQIQKIRESMKN